MKLAIVPEPVLNPTVDQRRIISTALFDCFDVAKGRYLGTESDEHLGVRLHVPWAMVTMIRDQMGFVIKANPELDRLEADIKGARSELDTVRTLLGPLESTVKSLEARLKTMRAA